MASRKERSWVRRQLSRKQPRATVLFTRVALGILCILTVVLCATLRARLGNFSVLLRDDTSLICGIWSLQALLLDSPRTSIEHSANDDIVHSIWRHERSGATAASGVTRTVVHHCKHNNPARGPNVSEHSISPSTTLCRGHGVVVLEVQEGTYRDWLLSGPYSTNLWHFHAAVVRLWVALHVVDVVEYDYARGKRGVQGFRLRYYRRPVVLVLPKSAWSKSRFPSDLESFQAKGDVLNKLLQLGALKSPLETIQGIGDFLGGHVLVARSGIKVSTMETAMKGAKMPLGIHAWVNPVSDGLLWDIAHDSNLAPTLTRCNTSLLQTYADEAIGRVEDGIATHVCIMSRQSRDPVEVKSRGTLRNLDPTFLLQLTQLISAPVILSPTLGLRTWNSSDTSAPASLVGMPAVEQLRYVRKECGVLLGVHGAGLANALGLKPGTSLIELLPKGRTYQYFRNMAALMNQVTYDSAELYSKQPNDAPENDLTMNKDDLRKLVTLISKRLLESINRQKEMRLSRLAQLQSL